MHRAVRIASEQPSERCVKMMIRFLILMLGVAAFCGCAQQEDSIDPGSAEIPAAGPAAQDPGPAPEGQWEPPGDDVDADSENATTGADDATEKTLDGAAEPENSPDPPSQSDDVSLMLQSWDETEQLIAAHQGKVVVVDFWSTSCLPCRREFPHLVALQKSHPNDIACVSVSLDYTGRKSRPPESYRDAVLGFLREQEAAIDNVLSVDDPDELEKRLALPPIPLVWVIDREGKRRREFDNADLNGEEFTYSNDVVPFVETLLAEN